MHARSATVAMGAPLEDLKAQEGTAHHGEYLCGL